MAARVTVYRSEAQQACYDETVDDRTEIARAAVDIARGNAPVQSGEYRDGMGVEVDGSDVRMVDDDPEAEFKEYGTSSTPAHAVMVNAASEFGKYSGVMPRAARTRARARRRRLLGQ